MRFFSTYLSREAAKNVNSVFEAKHYVKKIDKQDDVLFELVKMEEKDNREFEIAQHNRKIQDMINEQKEEIKDVESLVNQTFIVLRNSMLLIHTQLDILKRLMKEDDVLEHSGFPIEIANQLEAMLKSEIVNIVTQLHQMGEKMQNDSNTAKDPEHINDSDL